MLSAVFSLFGGFNIGLALVWVCPVEEVSVVSI